jgi:23S rRNA (cytidine1920-2'-O)/16S rRNA (cytidine1409-2'-O)-methyltransferase
MDNSAKTFVSRGGLKLQHALEQFKIDVSEKTALDVGSSTGGFVDCLLQNRASKVFALDTSYGELAWKLRNDPRVVVMERTNILHLESLPEEVDLITIDAGWTRLNLVLKIVKKFLITKGQVIALLKPHYEAEKYDLVKGVLKEEMLLPVKEKVEGQIKDLGFRILDECESPILGGGGNTEFLLLLDVVD